MLRVPRHHFHTHLFASEARIIIELPECRHDPAGLPLIHSHYTPLLFLLWAVFVLLCMKYGKQGSIIHCHAGWNPPSAETNLKSPINRFRGSPSCVLPVYRAESRGPLLRAVVPQSMKMNFCNVSSRSLWVLKVKWSWQSPGWFVMIKVRFLLADPTWHPVHSNDPLNLVHDKRGLGCFRDLHTLFCAWPKPNTNADLDLTAESWNFKKLAMLTLKHKGLLGYILRIPAFQPLLLWWSTKTT